MTPPLTEERLAELRKLHSEDIDSDHLAEVLDAYAEARQTIEALRGERDRMREALEGLAAKKPRSCDCCDGERGQG